MQPLKRKPPKQPARVWNQRTPEQWAALLAEGAGAGLAITGASKRLGINTATFASWERLFQHSKPQPSASAKTANRSCSQD